MLFVLGLLLRDFEAETFGLVVLASVTADDIGRAAFGPAAFLSRPSDFHRWHTPLDLSGLSCDRQASPAPIPCGVDSRT